MRPQTQSHPTSRCGQAPPAHPQPGLAGGHPGPARQKGGASAAARRTAAPPSKTSLLATKPAPPSQPRGRASLAASASATPPSASPSLSSSSQARSPPPPPSKKAVWLQTTNPAAAAAGLEAGLDTLVFAGPDPAAAAAAWGGLGMFTAVLVGGARPDGARPLVEAGSGVGLGMQVPLPDAGAAAALADLISSDSAPAGVLWAAPPPGAWSLIPTENLVAAAGGRAGDGSAAPRLFVSAPSADRAAGLLGALEAGAAGVVLVTDDPTVAREGGRLQASSTPTPTLALVPALVTATSPGGMGDRVCVDLTTAMAPGEGLLVGSFARGLALVQAEVESGEGYVATRPFRVNAGSLHSYVAAPGGRTAYLAELGAGDEVLIVDGGTGATRTGIVGRAKIERRPLVRVSLAIVPHAGAPPQPGDSLSLMLQAAETVRLVGPAAQPLPPAAAEVVRWVKEGRGSSVPALPSTVSLRASDSEALRWAMRSADDSSGEEGGEGEGGEGSGGERGGASARVSPYAAAAPDAQDALAWLMHDADGDGVPGILQGGGRGGGAEEGQGGKAGGGGSGASKARTSLSASTPVSALVPGATAVWVWRAPPARHTGIEVDEAIEER